MKVTDFNLLQFWNACAPIFFMFFPTVRLRSFLSEAKAFFAMEVTLKVYPSFFTVSGMTSFALAFPVRFTTSAVPDLASDLVIR